MNKITNEIINPYKATIALIFYSKESNNNNSVFVEQFPIIDGKLQNGYPASHELLSGICKSIEIKSNNIFKGRIPKNLLFIDPNSKMIIWSLNQSQRELYFTDDLGIENGLRWLPNLIFKYHDKEISVYAYKGSLKENTQLYRGPFMNVGTESVVCMGNAKSKTDPTDIESLMKNIEEKFFFSKFSHITGNNCIDGNYSVVMNKLLKTGEKFPEELLLKIKDKKLKDLYGHL